MSSLRNTWTHHTLLVCPCRAMLIGLPVFSMFRVLCSEFMDLTLPRTHKLTAYIHTTDGTVQRTIITKAHPNIHVMHVNKRNFNCKFNCTTLTYILLNESALSILNPLYADQKANSSATYQSHIFNPDHLGRPAQNAHSVNSR